MGSSSSRWCNPRCAISFQRLGPSGGWYPARIWIERRIQCGLRRVIDLYYGSWTFTICMAGSYLTAWSLKWLLGAMSSTSVANVIYLIYQTASLLLHIRLTELAEVEKKSRRNSKMQIIVYSRDECSPLSALGESFLIACWSHYSLVRVMSFPQITYKSTWDSHLSPQVDSSCSKIIS